MFVGARVHFIDTLQVSDFIDSSPSEREIVDYLKQLRVAMENPIEYDQPLASATDLLA